MKKTIKNEKIKIKSLKKSAREVVKEHYLLLLIVCLIAAFVGNGFTDALTITSSDRSVITDLIHIPNSIVQETNDIFGTSNGVFADIINSFASGTIFTNIVNGLTTIVGSDLIGQIIFVILLLLVVFIFWIFITNTYSVISRRIFLESRIYKKVSSQRFLFLYYVKKWFKVSWIMLVKSFYNGLWYLVFGIGFIKKYSYFLVPYILAENPNMKANQAITLSKKMMNGYKWKAFLIDLSYLGWGILRIITLGLSGLFYSNSYQIATYTEFYVELRTRAKLKNIENSNLLNDDYLYEKATSTQIKEAYSDIVEVLNSKITEIEQPKNIIGKVMDFFGLTFHRTDKQAKRELEDIKEKNAKVFEDIIENNQYPIRLFKLDQRTKKSKDEITNYMMKYTIPTVIMFFFIFSFIGWSWEVTLHIIKDGVFVNRGTYHGPWLPIYGSGSLLILLCLYKLRKKPIIHFIAAIVLCGLVEYFTAYYLEITHDGMKWWDYSGYFLNLHGRICGEGLLVFGLGGTAIAYVLAPALSNLISKINHKVLIVIVSLLLSIYLVDMIYSSNNPNTGKGISTGFITNQLIIDN